MYHGIFKSREFKEISVPVWSFHLLVGKVKFKAYCEPP